jgi:hypothetical protein
MGKLSIIAVENGDLESVRKWWERENDKFKLLKELSSDKYRIIKLASLHGRFNFFGGYTYI